MSAGLTPAMSRASFTSWTACSCTEYVPSRGLLKQDNASWILQKMHLADAWPYESCMGHKAHLMVQRCFLGQETVSRRSYVPVKTAIWI